MKEERSSPLFGLCSSVLAPYCLMSNMFSLFMKVYLDQGRMEGWRLLRRCASVFAPSSQCRTCTRCTIMHGRSATHDWSASDYTKPLHVMNEVIRKCVKENELIFGFYSLPVIFMIFSFFMVWLGSDFVCRLWGSMSHRWLCNAKIAIL